MLFFSNCFVFWCSSVLSVPSCWMFKYSIHSVFITLFCAPSVWNEVFSFFVLPATAAVSSDCTPQVVVGSSVSTHFCASFLHTLQHTVYQFLHTSVHLIYTLYLFLHTVNLFLHTVHLFLHTASFAIHFCASFSAHCIFYYTLLCIFFYTLLCIFFNTLCDFSTHCAFSFQFVSLCRMWSVFGRVQCVVCWWACLLDWLASLLCASVSPLCAHCSAECAVCKCFHAVCWGVRPLF